MLQITQSKNEIINVNLHGRNVDVLDFGEIIRTEARSKSGVVINEFFQSIDIPDFGVLSKYNINYDEYRKICSILEREYETDVTL